MKRFVLSIECEEEKFIYEINKQKLKEAFIDNIDFEIEFGDMLEHNKFEFKEITEEQYKQNILNGMLLDGYSTMEDAINGYDEYTNQ